MSKPHNETQSIVDFMERNVYDEEEVDYYELYDGSWDNEND